MLIFLAKYFSSYRQIKLNVKPLIDFFNLYKLIFLQLIELKFVQAFS